jgi:hypothetical protein
VLAVRSDWRFWLAYQSGTYCLLDVMRETGNTMARIGARNEREALLQARLLPQEFPPIRVHLQTFE